MPSDNLFMLATRLVEVDCRASEGCQLSELEHFILRFDAADWPQLRDFADAHPRQQEMLEVFPAACLALARLRGSVLVRAHAMELIRAGARLAEIAAALAIPLWMRGLPPEALHGALPNVEDMPFPDVDFGRRVGSLVPTHFPEGSAWLETVMKARRLCHDRFACWLLKATRGRPELLRSNLIEAIAAHAWFSCRPGTRGHELIETSWTPMMSMRRSMQATRMWLLRCALDTNEHRYSYVPRALRTATVRGHTFKRITTYAQMKREADAFRNCLMDYGSMISTARSHVFVVTHRRARVACVEVCAGQLRSLRTRVMQVLGPGNAEVSENVSDIVTDWFHERFSQLDEGVLCHRAFPIARDAWTEILAPYFEEMGRANAADLPHFCEFLQYASVMRDLGRYPRQRRR